MRRKRALALFLCVLMFMTSTPVWGDGNLTENQNNYNKLEQQEEEKVTETDSSLETSDMEGVMKTNQEETDIDNNEDEKVYFTDEQSGFVYYQKDTSNVILWRAEEFREESDPAFGTYIIPETIFVDSVEYNVTGIDEHAFDKVEVLHSIVLPDNVSEMGENTFAEFDGFEIYCNQESYACNFADSMNYNIRQGEIGIIFDSSNFTVGEQVQAQADNLPEFLEKEEKVWSSADDTIISIDENGLANVIAPGETQISMSVAGLKSAVKISSVEVESQEEIQEYQIKGRKGILGTDELVFGDFGYRIVDGHAVITGYIGSQETVVVPDTIDGYSVTEIGDGAFWGCDFLKKLLIPGSITKLGAAIIAGTSIKEIVVPKSVEESGVGWKNERYGALGGCQSLKYVVFEEGLEEIPDYICATPKDEECNGLEQIGLPSSVKRIGMRAFDNCKNLTSISLPRELVEIGVCAFENCKSLEELVLPEKLEIIGNKAFYECTNISKVSSQSEAEFLNLGIGSFQFCENLKEMNLSENTSIIGNSALSGCKSLKKFVIPKSVTKLGCWIIAGTSISKIEIPKSVHEAGWIGKEYYDYNQYYGALGNCPSLKTVVFEEGMEKIPSYICAAGDAATASGVQEVHIPSSVKEIGDGAFKGCASLHNLVIPKSVEKLGFEIIGKTSITKLIIPKSVKTTGYIYSGNDCLGALGGCPNLKTVAFEEGMEVIPDYICSSEWPGKGSGIEEISIPSSVKEIGNGAFKGCTSLKKLTIPQNVIRLGYGIIANTSISRIVIPKSVKLTGFNFNSSKFIGALGNCPSLKTIVFEEGMKKIPDEICSTGDKDTCTGVEDVYIPSSVNEIGNYVFRNCEWLDEIYFYGNAPNIANYSFSGVTAVAYYPKGNNTWNDTVMKSYGGDITWLEWNPVGFIPGDFNMTYDDTQIVEYWRKKRMNSVKYIAISQNFPYVININQNDGSPFGAFETTFDNLFLEGKDGIKNLLSGETSIKNAEEIIIGLTEEWETDIKEVAQVKEGKKWAGMYAKMLEQWLNFKGVDAEELNEARKYMQDDAFIEEVSKGDYNRLIEVVSKKFTKTNPETVRKHLEDFKVSDTLSKGLGAIDTGLTFIDLSKMTVDQIYQYCVMKDANEVYLEMLEYLQNNSAYVIPQAAKDLLTKARANVEETQAMLMAKVMISSGEIIGEKAIDELIDKCWFLKAVKSGIDGGALLSNLCFHTSDMVKLKDSMRICSYIGYTLSEWFWYNFDSYTISQNIDSKNYYATRTKYSMEMLLKIRMLGEETYQRLCHHFICKNGYNISLAVSANLKDLKEWMFDQTFIWENKLIEIGCPVDVEIYDLKGNKICTVEDGAEDSGCVGDIYYDVVYNNLSNEYLKIIQFPEPSQYEIRIVGNDLGRVDIDYLNIQNEGVAQLQSIGNLAIQKGSKMLLYTEDMTRIHLNNGNDEELELKELYNSENYRQVTGIKVPEYDKNLYIGGKKLLEYDIEPINANCKDVNWSSVDETVATVNEDGVVTGVSEGKTSIIASTIEGGFQVEYEVVVNGIFPGDLDGDGKVKIADLMKILHYLSGSTTLDDAQRLAADVDRDNKVTIKDIIRILHYISGSGSL